MRNRFSVVPAAAATLGSVVAAHALAYALAHADSVTRAHHLDASGHGYFGTLAAVAISAALIALGMGILGSIRGEASVHRRSHLAWLSCGTFVVLEVIERLITGSLATLWDEPAVLIALPLTLIAAWVAAALGNLSISIGRALAYLTRRVRLGVPGALFAISADSFPLPSGIAGDVRARGPPLNHRS